MKIKLVSYFMLLLLLFTIYYQIVFEIAFINMDSIDIKLIKHNEQDYIYTQKLDSSKFIFLKFNYTKQYKHPLSILNSFVYQMKFKKKKVKNIDIFMLDENNKQYNINVFLTSFIDRHIFTEYVNNNISTSNSEDRYDKLLDTAKFVYEVYYELCKENTKQKCDILAKIKTNTITSIDTLRNIKLNDIETITINSGSNTPYVGNISFFIELYNEDYIQIDTKEMYQGFLMELRRPPFIKKAKMIKIIIEFDDGTTLNSTTPCQ